MPLETIHEPARRTDVVHEADVLVVGSGPGMAAALSRKSNRALNCIDVSMVQSELDRQDARYA